jgi:hypothetical protein
MKIPTVVMFAATSAGFVPRPTAPLLDPIQGTGVSAVGAGWRRDVRVTTTIEHDSVGEALTV